MGGRILVVDDLEPNRRVLQARLEADDYAVFEASDGPEALALIEANPPDLILLDVMMPEMDGFEVARRVKANPARAHIPIIMVTALTEHQDRITGLQAGADDFLSKPWDDAVLIARVRSLLRLKGVMDQLALREETGAALQAMAPEERDRVGVGARILIIDDANRSAERLARRLEDEHRPRLETDQASAFRAARGRWDLLIIHAAARSFDGLKLIERFQAEESTRQNPILAIVDAGARELTLAALDAGASDVIERPVDGQELSARVKSVVKQKRYADFLRDRLDVSIAEATQDQLTQTGSQRFTEVQLRALMAEASELKTPLSVALVDVDGFRDINARRGHRGGDIVLRAVADVMRANVGEACIMGRRGGDEFMMLIPGASADHARVVCKAVREGIAAEPVAWEQDGGQACEENVTVSIGLTEFASGDALGPLLDRAVRAIDAAKDRGGNRVVTALRKSVAA